uniref:Retrotransposon protein n=1 Tax=Cucumis melo TaxID=3656 RepID=A0A9I9E7P7_CUCME
MTKIRVTQHTQLLVVTTSQTLRPQTNGLNGGMHLLHRCSTNGSCITGTQSSPSTGRGGMPSRLPRGLGEHGGWRSDKGTYRPSYLAQLIRMLRERMLDCGLTTTVIESRI